MRKKRFYAKIKLEEPKSEEPFAKGGDVVAEKDSAEKILEAYNDVFSDIVNVLLFEGEEVLRPEELEDQAPRSYYKADGKLHEIERDVAKRWKKEQIRVACIGLENQTGIDPDMPLRVIGYDGAEYRAQLLADQKDAGRYPVVTLVLYFGYKKHWDKPTSLLERVNVPERFRPFVNDYKVNLFEIAYLTREQVALFQSDFRVVADYFVQKREQGDYTPTAQELRHVQETLQLLSVMTGDHRFEEAYDPPKEGGPQNMCEVLDRVEKKGRQAGMQAGMRTGIQQGEDMFALLVKKLLECGRMEDIRRVTEEKDYRQQLMREMHILP